MPTYEYECQECHERVEAVQKFTDAPLTLCPHCGGELRKVFSAVGIVFKGSGFYKNDSRGSKSDSSKSESTKPESAKSESSASPKTESAATTSATPASSTSASGASAPAKTPSSTSSN
jgi:putative FmdB family regulatory protein